MRLRSNKPLGTNIHAITHIVDKTNTRLIVLFDNLLHFNKVAYVPAKHVYGLPDDISHFFDEEDSINITLIGAKLAEELKKRSQYVRNYCQDLVLPAQQPIIGKWKRTDNDGVPFNFKNKLIESKDLDLDVWGRPI